ncbi:MAG TPA: hypothetical protein PKI33_08910 [Anaerolineales bacterium]|nr:hypothetical protein [Anaerolineales bacterium]
MKKYPIVLLSIVVLILSACGSKGDEVPDVLLTPPAIVVNASRDNCPSIIAEVGMTIAWENIDTVPLPIKIEFLDENGKVTDTGLSVIDPETVFSTQFPNPGVYRVYCTDNTDTYSTITVK